MAVHRVELFEVPRPRGLLGHAALTRLLSAVEAVIGRAPGAFSTIRLSAAGADSPEMTRLRDAIAGPFGLRPVAERAQLLVAVRRAPGETVAWEVLIRTTPRPLSARAWRVCDFPGALDATVAAAMVRLMGAPPDQRFLNLACGSATLLAERLASGRVARAVGIDRDEAVLECARSNLAAAGVLDRVRLCGADVAALPLGDRSFDAAVADLPFGQLSGTTAENRSLYPALLGEAARVVAPGGSFAAITAHGAALAAALRENASGWSIVRQLPVDIPFARGYVKATIWLLRR